MTKLYDLIERILETPESFLGRCSVQRLYAFIGGYLEGHPMAEDHCLDGFHDYVLNRYGQNTTHNWASVIEFYSGSERSEMELFQKHFEAFTALKKQGCEKKSDMGKGITVIMPSQYRLSTGLSDLIGLILKRPEIYIGRCSIQRLYAWISGYLYENEALNDHCLDGFDEYLAQYYHIAPAHNWADTIAFFSKNEAAEMELFRKHFLEYTA